MKLTSAIALIFALSASCIGTAQSADMKDMDMKDMDMKDMDMKDMDMKDMSNKPHANGTRAAAHKAIAIVKGVDAANGKVNLAHEPVKSLNWPAMTMGFSVKDPALLDKLAVGKKVEVEFVQQGSDYVITAVK